MEIETASHPPSATIRLTRDDLVVFRALLDRASFVDTPPEMQPRVLDMIDQIREMLPSER